MMSTNAIIIILLLMACCIAAGALVCYAIPNLKQEDRALEKCRSFFETAQKKIAEQNSKTRQQEHDSYLDFLGYCGRLKRGEEGNIAEINHFADSKEVPGAIITKEGGKEVKKPSYVSDRLFVILCATSTANLVRKVPPLTDLHELTQQQERGELSTAAFRALTPAMLVIGILGTLIGVHQQLSDPSFLESGTINRLVSALGPGIMAVLGTIICIVLRGVYNSRYAKYTTQLDEFTLKHLLPFFRPKGELETDAETFDHTMRRIVGLDYEALGGHIAAYHAAVSDCHAVCASLPRMCGKGVRDLATLESRILDVGEQAGKQKRKLNADYVEFSHAARRYTEISRTLAMQTELMTEPMLNSAQQAGELMTLLKKQRAAAEMDWQRLYVASRRTNRDMEHIKLPDVADFSEKSDSYSQWLQADLATKEQHYADLSAPVKDFLVASQTEIQDRVRPNAVACQARMEKLTKVAQQLKPKIVRSREQRVKLWQDANANLIRWQDKYLGDWKASQSGALYPKGWVGMQMRLRDALERGRGFFYRTPAGRVCGVVLVGLFFAFLYWV